MNRDTRHSPLFKTPNQRNRSLRQNNSQAAFTWLKILTAVLCLVLVVQLYHRRDWFRNIPKSAPKTAVRKADSVSVKAAEPKPEAPLPDAALPLPAGPAKPGLFTRIRNTFNPPKAPEQDEIFALDGPLDTLFRHFGVDKNEITRKIKNLPKYYIEETVRLPKGRPLPAYVVDIKRLAEARTLSLSDVVESGRDTSVTLDIWGKNKMIRRIVLSYGSTYTPGFARIAFFLEGFGPTLSPEEMQVFAVLKRPVTVGIVPLSAEAAKSCDLARQNGFEVVCQIPMENKPSRPMGENALYKHFDAQKVKKLLFDFSKSLPDIKGYAVYGGGTRIVEDEPDILKAVLEFAKSEEHYFIDNSFASRSRVEEFSRAGNITFIKPVGIGDRENDPVKVRETLLRFANTVKKTGKGLVLLKNGPKSAKVLQEAFAAIEEQGITIVTVSSLFK